LHGKQMCMSLSFVALETPERTNRTMQAQNDKPEQDPKNKTSFVCDRTRRTMQCPKQETILGRAH